MLSPSRLLSLKCVVSVLFGVAASRGISLAAEDSGRIALSVVVQAGHDRDVTDIAASDLSLSDDTHPQKDLRLTRLQPAAAGRLTVLIDTSSPNCMRQASDFVSGLASVPVAIYDATQLRQVQGETADRAALAQAIANLQNGSDGAPAAPDEKVGAVIQAAQELVSEQHMRPWVALAFALAMQNGSNGGRKDIVFFATEDEQAAAVDELQTLAADLSRSETALYVVQLPVMSAAEATKAKKLIAGKPKRGAATEDEKTSTAAVSPSAMKDLAIGTGGLYASGRSVSGVLKGALEDLSSAYEVSYDAGPDTTDGRYHPLAIECSRAGAHVRGPSGYFAVPASMATHLRPFEADLFGALHTTTSDTAFPVDCAALQFGVLKNGVRTEVVVQIPSAGLQAQSDENLSSANVRYSELAVISDNKGHIVDTLSRSGSYTGADANMPDLFTLSRAIVLQPGKYRLQAVARDDNAGQMSGKSVAFEIAPADAKNSLADIVVVRGADKLIPGEKDPLNYGSARLVPFASPRIALGSEAQMPVLLTISGPDADSVTGVDLEIERDSKAIATVPVMGGQDQAGNYRALLFLEQQSLPPGHYTLVAQATTRTGTLERRSDIEIIPPDAVRGQYGGMQGAVLKPVLDIDQPELLTPSSDPSKDPDLDTILARARDRAISYKDKLPNFLCVVNTQQYMARASEHPDWKVKGDMSEVLRYVSGSEQYNTVAVNGERKSIDHAKLPGLKMDGEFGELMTSIFAPEAKAQFKLKGKARMGGVDVWVLEYSVERKHSNYAISTYDGFSRVLCAFRGYAYIDANNYATRSVSIQAVDVPKQAQYTESTLAVTYDYINVNGEQFLLPKRAWVAVRVGTKKLLKDEMQFRDYHRFHSTSKITF